VLHYIGNLWLFQCEQIPYNLAKSNLPEMDCLAQYTFTLQKGGSVVYFDQHNKLMCLFFRFAHMQKLTIILHFIVLLLINNPEKYYGACNQQRCVILTIITTRVFEGYEIWLAFGHNKISRSFIIAAEFGEIAARACCLWTLSQIVWQCRLSVVRYSPLTTSHFHA